MATVKTLNGLALASMKTRNGLAAASVKTINGLDSVSAFGGLVSTTSLVDWWPLSEASGTRVGVHAGLDLTDNNTVTGVSGGGPDGSDVSQFTRANAEYLSRTSEAALQIGGTAFTVTGWIYFDSLTASQGRTFAGKWLTGNYEWVIQYETPAASRLKMYFASGGPVIANTFGAMSTGTWYFICGRWAANVGYLSVNAGTEDTASITAPSSGSAAFMIGRNQDWGGGGGDHDGRIQRVGLWKRVLTGAEISALYNSGNGLDY